MGTQAITRQYYVKGKFECAWVSFNINTQTCIARFINLPKEGELVPYIDRKAPQCFLDIITTILNQHHIVINTNKATKK
jgi:hypothetical protein